MAKQAKSKAFYLHLRFKQDLSRDSAVGFLVRGGMDEDEANEMALAADLEFIARLRKMSPSSVRASS